ncbi:MAG TPA: radical SAM protein [Blastocatellia bacterium]|jgi:MoaA/NifB/PqqE/SkfB family radical SAM enzyme|nr:radical SAM protein [Blastocatellia bacterium]
MKEEKLVGACWILTAVCNLKCPMCYSYLGQGSADISKKRAIVDRLREYGLQKIMFTGGDPTIDRDLVQIVQYAKLKGFKTAISTNGILLSEALMQALDCCLDELTLPIDGSVPEIHGNHRGQDSHLDTVMRLLKQVKNYGFQTDVSTVVTRLNLGDILNILRLVESEEIKKWKVFQYDGLMQDENTYRALCISHAQFEEVIATVNAHKTRVSVDFRFSSPEVMRSYLSISPLGDILLVNSNQYKKVGSVFDNRSLKEILTSNNFSFDIHTGRHIRDTKNSQQLE